MLFVIGYSRSGMTMMGRIIGQNPKVQTFGMPQFFAHLVDDAADIQKRGVLRAWANYYPAMIARLWSRVSKLDRLNQGDPRFMLVCFEVLPTHPEVQAPTVAANRSLALSDRMLDVPQLKSLLKQYFPGPLGVNPNMVDGWINGSLSETGVGLCEWLASAELIARGYALSGQCRFAWKILPSLILLIAKLSITLTMNLARTKIDESLQLRFGKGT